MVTFPRGTYNQKSKMMIYKFSINNLCIHIYFYTFAKMKAAKCLKTIGGKNGNRQYILQ
jgi:hypothetical protein